MFSPIVLVDGVFFLSSRFCFTRARILHYAYNTYTHITRRVIYIYLGRGDCGIICFAYYYVIMTTLFVPISYVPTRILCDR